MSKRKSYTLEKSLIKAKRRRKMLDRKNLQIKNKRMEIPIQQTRFNQYKAGARKRNHDFQLSFEEFMTMWQKSCGYCDSNIETIGIDRLDSKKGYISGNVMSCCPRCNFIKHTMSFGDFVSFCVKIANKHGFKVS